MPTVLVTGSCQGLGFEFCRQYTAAGWGVLATCLAPGTADNLARLAAQFPRVTVFALDMRDFAAIDRLAESLAEAAIDLLICNAGVNPDNSGPGFGSLDHSTWGDVLTVNTLAPVKLTEAFLPHLKRGRKR
jgi:NAD(P)-dependent dehydrogenase (short-subunit alcohol dehydrogenase family)